MPETKRMLLIALPPILVALTYFAYDPLIEAPRLKSQTEKDLSITFDESPKLLDTENFGWAEEGGDRSVLELSPQDCAIIAKSLGTLEDMEPDSDYMRMFKSSGVAPAKIRKKYLSNAHGDSKLYVLAPSSCVLFREAFFE